MTYYAADTVYNRVPMLVCNRCATFVDLDTKQLVDECKATWEIVSDSRGKRTHYCPTCKEERAKNSPCAR